MSKMFNPLVSRYRSMRRFVTRRVFFVVALADFFGRRAFLREISAVYSGMRKHHTERREGRQVYFVRRHIHMLEKGLSMMPRRETFAKDYIVELVSAVANCSEVGLLDEEAVAWVADTLDSYFAAMKDTDSIEISRARQLYESVSIGPRADSYLGPAPVKDLALGLPAYEELLALAHARQSVRWFSPRLVDRRLVDNAITVGMQAPSACNRLPYRFLVIDDPTLIRKVASIPGGTGGYVHNLVGLVVLVGDLSAYAHSRDRHLIYVDSSLASMGFLFAMQAQGISTCCINWPDSGGADAKIAGILGLAKYERTIMLVAYGYALPSGIVPGSGKREINSIRLFFNG